MHQPARWRVLPIRRCPAVAVLMGSGLGPSARPGCQRFRVNSAGSSRSAEIDAGRSLLDQNGLTITRITIAIISSVGTSLRIR